MKLFRLLSLFFAILIAIPIYGRQQKINSVSILPAPSSMKVLGDKLTISNGAEFNISDIELAPLVILFNERIQALGLKSLNISEGSKQAEILLEINPSLKNAEYKLDISDKVHITAVDYNGISKGLVTLLQVLEVNSDQAIEFPKLLISDQADYSHRSVMLDVARFWHPVETLKETIDLLWFYKIPYLHLHLTDNRRFTFPLSAYPKLKNTYPDGQRATYTLEEMKSLVEYAKVRGIAIIPEIELPGHSSILWQQYPEIFGSIDPETNKPVLLYVVNMANETTYSAIEEIIKTVAEVFYTSPYIHFGGDEVYLEPIKGLPEYQAFTKEKGLSKAQNGDVSELFRYFINRVNGMVKATGKKSMIWEGFSGGENGDQTIAKDIKIIVWNTTYNTPQNLIDQGYEIINSTWLPWYMVGAMNMAPDPKLGYNWDVTDWNHWNEEIAPIQLTSNKGIIGGQISYWEQNHFKVIPVLRDRVPVLSERLWNNSKTDYTDFEARLKHTDSVYGILFHPVKIEVKGLINAKDQSFVEKVEVHLSSEVNGQIRYSYSDSWYLPEAQEMSNYSDKIELDESGILTVQLFENNTPIGFPEQKYYRKIAPIYKVTMYGGAPLQGWESMPDFSGLDTILTTYGGRMNTSRVEKINEELFAKVQPIGHIETRYGNVYNPYALELKGELNFPETEEITLKVLTDDGLVELAVDGKVVAERKEIGKKADEFKILVEKGMHSFTIKYYYRHIQNQLNILYKTGSMDEFEPFENLVLESQD